MSISKVYFVSGIDTGVGKTVATGLMARWLAATGHDVTTVKLVQTGNTGFSEDIAEQQSCPDRSQIWSLHGKCCINDH